MQCRLGGLVAALSACAALCAPVASAQAHIAFAACGESNEFACGHLTVPLDPNGTGAGTLLTLAIRRHRAAVEGADSAIIALAGGPGQAAIPHTEAFLDLLGPIAATRDLIVFDQRGTGLSHPLSCWPPRGAGPPRPPRRFPSLGEAVQQCADLIGPQRSFFTTPDSVADIEAIRRAGGYEKLVLYGTSYGTKVAEQYAETYPDRVEALVLDSVVPPNGPDPLHRPTFAAVPRVLRQLCAFRECAHITPDPVADLARLVQQLSHRPLSARAIDAHGRPQELPVDSDELLAILLDGDFDPLLRAEFVPAVRAAAHGDGAALARLLLRSFGGEAGGSDGGIDGTLYLTTTCEEQQFSWDRGAAPRERLREALGQLDSLPPATFDPFTAANALSFSPIRRCAYWPFSTPAPPLAQAPLPSVPTLVLSGAADLRTPTSGASEVAQEIPGAHLLVVPLAGHSVLGNEPTPCARRALQGMFAGQPIRSCPPLRPPPILRLPPLPPPALSFVTPAGGYRGATGRTLGAVIATLRDFARQFTISLLERLESEGSLRFGEGGLRAGWYRFDGRALSFHGYSYIPGVSVSGRIDAHGSLLRIGGPAAAHGTLRLPHGGPLTGTLGGRRIRIPRTRLTGVLATSASAVPASAAPTPGSFSLHLLARARPALRALPSGLLDGEELALLLSPRLAEGPLD
jgi:pimeloyl-ACP methyl ester carboxylesterase